MRETFFIGCESTGAGTLDNPDQNGNIEEKNNGWKSCPQMQNENTK